MRASPTPPTAPGGGRFARLADVHTSTFAWGILTLSLLLTAIAWNLSNRYINERAADRFRYRTAEVQEAVRLRMVEYEQVLRAGVGLFEASESVSRAEWNAYVATLALEEYYPGIQGMGVALFVAPEERGRFVQATRDEGFPDFDIKPEGQRPIYSAIVYLEPFDWRNRRAFGYDMYSEPTRRAAMDQAVETGRPTISGMVTLVQETETDVQRGFLVYQPIFDNGLPHATPEERRAAALGFVYAPFRANDLMAGILTSELPDIDFEIFDGAEISAEALLFDSDGELHLDRPSDPAAFSQEQSLHLNGSSWTLFFESQPGFISTGESLLSLLVACGGLTVDVLLFLVIGSIGRQRQKAVRLAEGMTAAFRNTQRQFQAVCDTANDPIVLLDSADRIVYHNPSTERAFGYGPGELVGLPLLTLFAEDPPVQGADARADAPNRGNERECRRKNGVRFPVDVSVSRWEADGGQCTAMVLRDITDLKEREALIRRSVDELKRSNRDLDDFAYVASHDLRSPLRGISHLATWVIDDSGDRLPAESKRHLLSLRDRVGRMDRLLDDLLQYSRAGRARDQLGELDSRELCESIASLLEKPAPFTICVDDTLPRFTTLRTPLETCLRNLINNAIKHHDREDGAIHVSAIDDGPFVRFVVADDGPGIDPRFHQRIFTIFQTLAAKGGAETGSGIGLSIIKKTAETYGGSIEVESAPGRGARFSLAWPRAIPAGRIAESPPA